VTLEEDDKSAVYSYEDIISENYTNPVGGNYKAILHFSNQLFTSNFLAATNSTLHVKSRFDFGIGDELEAGEVPLELPEIYAVVNFTEPMRFQEGFSARETFNRNVIGLPIAIIVLCFGLCITTMVLQFLASMIRKLIKHLKNNKQAPKYAMMPPASDSKSKDNIDVEMALVSIDANG